ncbi:MAG: hypothetical protein U1E26_07955 [Coriobacteriia bacterium]|nr:hypothetical protein [Coriobacteriia bacterium]
MRDLIPDAWYVVSLVSVVLLPALLLYTWLVFRGRVHPVQSRGPRETGDQAQPSASARLRTITVLSVTFVWMILPALLDVEVAYGVTLVFSIIGALVTAISLRPTAALAQRAPLSWSDTMFGVLVPVGIVTVAKFGGRGSPAVGLDVGYSAAAGYALGFAAGWFVVARMTARRRLRQAT